jgi:hypothetical protein
MTSHSSTRISVLTPAIRRSRHAFLTQLSATPKIVRQDLTRHYRERIRRAKGKPLLGEYAPWLLADLLSIQNPVALNAISLPWMHLYAYTLTIDDVLDRPGSNTNAPLIVASGLLLQRGLSGLCQALPRSDKVRVQLDKYFLESAAAVMTELRLHRGRVQSFSKRDVSEVGKKVSLLKLCASCLLIADNRSGEDDAVLAPVGFLATGMQLLDDMADWEEDWKQGAFSSLLSDALKGLRKLGIARAEAPESLKRSELLLGLVMTGSLEKSLRKALDCLRQIEPCGPPKPHSVSRQFLNSVLRENGRFLEETVKLRVILERRRLKLKDTGFDWLSRLSSDKLVDHKLVHFERKLGVVAASS